MLWSLFSEYWVLSKLFHSPFTFIKRLFNSSSQSTIRVVSSAYLRLWIFLPAVLSPACASSILAFHMMYSAYKLKEQGDNIQPWCTPFPMEPVHCSMPSSVSSWPTYRFLRRQVRCSHILISLRIFHILLCSTQRHLCSQWSRNRCFSGIPLFFLLSNKCGQFYLWFLWVF